MSRSLRTSVVLTALLLCGSNAIKPLVVDDPAFVAVAEQITRSPSDPYGFEIFWYERPTPASEVLAPPVIPYWIAGAMTIFGDEPVAWKLSLVPFALLLSAGLASLLQRLAPPIATPLLWLAITTPALLPNLNLMLDVPALALGIAAVAAFARACDDDRLPLALLAGLLGGLSMQTKYTGVTYVATLVVYGLLWRRVGLALLAGAVATATWASWEAFVYQRYGTSQLVHTFSQIGISARSPTGTFLGLLSLLGGAAPAVLPLACAAARARVLLGITLVTALPFALLPLLPRAAHSSALMPSGANASGLELLAYTGIGAGIAIAAAVACWRGLSAREDRENSDSGPGRTLTRFAVAWLAIQLLGFPLLAPFLATRRAIGVAVALVVALGHLATRRLESDVLQRRIRPIVVLGAVIGMLFVVADTLDADARRRAVDEAQARLIDLGADTSPSGERVWFAGHWGPQFYAQRAGFTPLVPGESAIAAGDWVLVVDGVKRQHFGAPQRALVSAAVVKTHSPFPWSTIPSAHLGRIPIRPQPDAQIRLQIYRATEDFVPSSRARRATRIGERLLGRGRPADE